MLLLRADRGASGRVFLGGKEVDRVRSVRALWNGGPGIVEYTPTTADGHLLLTDNGKRMATAFRIGMVRVEMIQKGG